MTKILDKINIKTGKDTSNKFDLSCCHATTSNFYVPRVTYYHEFVGGEKWKLNAKCVVKTLAMERPTFADVVLHNRFFFVPYFAIFPRWDAFLAESPVSDTGTLHIPNLPIINEFQIVNVFCNSYFSEAGTEQHYDFIVDSSASANVYRVLTASGRIALSILQGLGFNINWSCTGSTAQSFNALSLLCYLKVYLDWYNNSAFANKAILRQWLDNTEATDGHIFTVSELIQILMAMTNLYFEKDYFTSATLYPIGTNDSTMQGAHSIVDITTNNLATYSNPGSSVTHGTPQIQQSDSSNINVATKYSIDAVNALTDYVKRHQLAGIQPFNRVLAEYGITLDDEALRRSTFIGDIDMRLNIDEVTSQSYADGTQLGNIAGNARAYAEKFLDFSNKNFGSIICITTIVPRTSYVDGVRRHNLRLQRFDFFTPSVEHLGTEPVLVRELFNNYCENESNKPAKDAIFGYLPRYASYKVAHDTFSGDFNIRSRQLEYEPWILRRLIKGSSPSTYNTISEEFTRATYSKISSPFLSSQEDNFIIFNMWHCSAILPMHKLWDDYQWSNEDDNPQEVTMSNQGVQLT